MTTYTEEDKETLILSLLIRFVDHHPEIDRRFIDDVFEFMDKHGYITDGQLDSLEEIYSKHSSHDFFDWMFSEAE
jgi:hypothetical protein